MRDAAARIAKDGQENLDGLDVVSVGPMWANDVDGETYIELYAVVPDHEGDDFVVRLITLAHVQDVLLAQINHTALIMALETHFGRVQIFGAKHDAATDGRFEEHSRPLVWSKAADA
jgi:hypothetical protein